MMLYVISLLVSYCVTISMFFFFSSRRRHTRFDCDWSSDVCSSDLHLGWRFPNPRMEAMFPLESMGETGENVAEQYGVTREDQDAFALASQHRWAAADRKSTRLNSSHSQISYAVFCLKKKKTRLMSFPATLDYDPICCTQHHHLRSTAV